MGRKKTAKGKGKQPAYSHRSDDDEDEELMQQTRHAQDALLNGKPRSAKSHARDGELEEEDEDEYSAEADAEEEGEPSSDAMDEGEDNPEDLRALLAAQAGKSIQLAPSCAR
jgi:hypothetical protein